MSDTLEALLEGVPKQARDKNIIYWDELCADKPKVPVALYGGGSAGANVAAHLLREKINLVCFIDKKPSSDTLLDVPIFTPHEAAKYLGKDAMVIVTVGKYWTEEAVHNDIRQTVSDAGFSPPYYIHEFSYGYHLGAERIFEERGDIKKAFSMLADDLSRTAFTEYMENALINFRWSMSFGSATLGAPDVYGAYVSPEACFIAPQFNGALLYCSANDFDAGDPDLLLCGEGVETVFFYPVPLYRYKLKELLYKKGADNFTVLDNVLADKDGQTNIKKYEFMGGTPLKAPFAHMPCQGVTVDAFLKEYGSEVGNVGMIKLDMRDGYAPALRGAKQTIAAQKPVIAVNGFSRVHHLWETVLDLAHRLDGYRLHLRRYPHVNRIMGHTVYAVYADK